MKSFFSISFVSMSAFKKLEIRKNIIWNGHFFRKKIRNPSFVFDRNLVDRKDCEANFHGTFYDEFYYNFMSDVVN